MQANVFLEKYKEE